MNVRKLNFKFAPIGNVRPGRGSGRPQRRKLELARDTERRAGRKALNRFLDKFDGE